MLTFAGSESAPVALVMPKPTWVWSKRGLDTPNPPNQEDLETSRHKRMAGFVYRGNGWYPAPFKCLVLSVPGGFNLYFYDQDPRPAFAALGGADGRLVP